MTARCILCHKDIHHGEQWQPATATPPQLRDIFPNDALYQQAQVHSSCALVRMLEQDDAWGGCTPVYLRSGKPILTSDGAQCYQVIKTRKRGSLEELQKEYSFLYPTEITLFLDDVQDFDVGAVIDIRIDSITFLHLRQSGINYHALLRQYCRELAKNARK